MNRTPNLSAATWRKSSYSDGGDNNCLEVTDEVPGIVPVRDSKAPDRRPLLFSPRAWSTFVKVVAAG
ncbi:DUF397 domain-containing protein [Streptomyces europaeiscabiei]|uniref:DUF397 domain-containing protein n=1 Tax=Streptomyces europaeiscabiei TaxID=146819 RepID=UPI0029B37CE2|nr:DUF397 domain-containing protein [Streptomyces europaeiscabiei]MDX3635764.1 DUF397 domain-containing protein [Streptomyces europaeiscabiei]MDX3653199.1 DUF397 domain-containing protein [Streptomyces europaeiscabiei]WUD33698.1 DUF397 domain-containing protein [Streptomyces europaeiscabiei]